MASKVICKCESGQIFAAPFGGNRLTAFSAARADKIDPFNKRVQPNTNCKIGQLRFRPVELKQQVLLEMRESNMSDGETFNQIPAVRSL